MNELKLVEIFCKCDDFCQKLAAYTTEKTLPGQWPYSRLCLSEILTLCIAFHLSGYKTFKQYYTELVLVHWQPYFPELVSYERFVALQQQTVLPLYAFLWSECIGEPLGLSFVDSFKLAVCHNRRIFSHRVFQGLAARGKTSVDWFFGFKMHLVINPGGEMLGFALSAGNTDDRNRAVFKQLTHFVKGLLVADRGYISQQLTQQLAQQGIHLLTKLKRTMKNALLEEGLD
jgi:hypothetical protein